MAGHFAVARVNGSALADLNVFGLGFRNANLGLKAPRIRYPRQVRAGRHALAHLDRNLLEHARDAGAQAQRASLAGSEQVQRAVLLHLGVLRGQL